MNYYDIWVNLKPGTDDREFVRCLRAAKRSGALEELHSAVYSKVTDFRAALYRDFPDPVREE